MYLLLSLDRTEVGNAEYRFDRRTRLTGVAQGKDQDLTNSPTIKVVCNTPRLYCVHLFHLNVMVAFVQPVLCDYDISNTPYTVPVGVCDVRTEFSGVKLKASANFNLSEIGYNTNTYTKTRAHTHALGLV